MTGVWTVFETVGDWSHNAWPTAVSAETAGSVCPEDVNSRLEHRPS